MNVCLNIGNREIPNDNFIDGFTSANKLDHEQSESCKDDLPCVQRVSMCECQYIWGGCGVYNVNENKDGSERLLKDNPDLTSYLISN